MLFSAIQFKCVLYSDMSLSGKKTWPMCCFQLLHTIRVIAWETGFIWRRTTGSCKESLFEWKINLEVVFGGESFSCVTQCFFCESERSLQNPDILIAFTVLFGFECAVLYCIIFNNNNNSNNNCTKNKEEIQPRGTKKKTKQTQEWTTQVFRQCPTSSWPKHFWGHTKVENSISCHVAVAAYHSQIFQASHYHIWLRCREMIQMRVSGNWHTLLTQLLLTPLLPHSIIVKDNRLECASVIRWWRWTPAGSVKSTIKECVMNRMISKPLPNVCVSLYGEGFLPVYSCFEFQLMTGGLLLTGFGKT